MTHPSPQNETTPATGTDGAPAKQHGDPLLNAAQRDEDPTGSRRRARGTGTTWATPSVITAETQPSAIGAGWTA